MRARIAELEADLKQDDDSRQDKLKRVKLECDSDAGPSSDGASGSGGLNVHDGWRRGWFGL